MKISQGTRTPIQSAPVAPVVPALTNLTFVEPVKLTVQMDGFPPINVELENEAEVRNVVARFAPTSLIRSNAEQVLEHVTDDTDPLFQAIIMTAKAMGLSLPQGI